ILCRIEGRCAKRLQRSKSSFHQQCEFIMQTKTGVNIRIWCITSSQNLDTSPLHGADGFERFPKRHCSLILRALGHKWFSEGLLPIPTHHRADILHSHITSETRSISEGCWSPDDERGTLPRSITHKTSKQTFASFRFVFSSQLDFHFKPRA